MAAARERGEDLAPDEAAGAEEEDAHPGQPAADGGGGAPAGRL
jgi:hypothetical protein